MIRNRNNRKRPTIGQVKKGTLDYERIYMRRVLGLTSDFATLADFKLIKQVLMYETPMTTNEVLNILSYWDERQDLEIIDFNRILTRYLNGSNRIKGAAPKAKIDVNGLITRSTLKTYEMAVTYILLSETNLTTDDLDSGNLGVYVSEVIKRLKD